MQLLVTVKIYFWTTMIVHVNVNMQLIIGPRMKPIDIWKFKYWNGLKRLIGHHFHDFSL